MDKYPTSSLFAFMGAKQPFGLFLNGIMIGQGVTTLCVHNPQTMWLAWIQFGYPALTFALTYGSLVEYRKWNGPK
jgi:hypothetical protein